MNIKNIDKIDIESIIKDANVWYQEHGRDEKFIMLEKLVLSKNNPYYNYMFAKNVAGADIKTFENAILKSRSHKYIYYFGRDIKGASYKLFISKDLKEDEIFVVAPLKQMSVQKEELLNSFFKNVKFRYNSHGLFIVEIMNKDSSLSSLFYIDEYTKKRVQNLIDNKESVEPLFLYYAVQSGNYNLVKTILDYNNYNEVNYRNFKLTDTFATLNKNIIAHDRPSTTLVNEAKYIDDKRIIRLLRAKIKEQNLKNETIELGNDC